MGTTGLIYAAIAVAWLVYLIPWRLRKSDADNAQVDPDNRFSESMRILARGTAPLVDQDLRTLPRLEISTPLTRRAAIEDLRRLQFVAARRRRRVLLVLMGVLTVVVVVCLARWLSWWSVAVPAGLLLGFFAASRISVRALRRSLDQRYARIVRGGDETTVFLSREDVSEAKPSSGDEAVRSSGTLWDPVPITLPTYVSKPLAPRTVRTIDLSAPDLTTPARSLPVTADRPSKLNENVDEDEAAASLAEHLRRAVGE